MSSLIEQSCKQIRTAFPHCQLLNTGDYYLIRPKKEIHLMISWAKPNQEGIYIWSESTILVELATALSSFEVVNNFYDEMNPWLFISFQSETFHADFEKTINWIKQRENKIFGENA